jgi:NADH:ubiquinone oxidoreductase subunit 6 (subunit J)
VLLIGSLPQPITSGPLVLFVYLILIVMVGSALASVLLRNLLYAMGAFAATMVMVSLLYLTIAPFLLFVFQLLVFSTVSAAVLFALLRDTTGLRNTALGPFSREWIIGGAVAGALLALVAVVMALTSWPTHICCGLGLPGDLGSALRNGYVVALATAAILLSSAALGSGLLLAAPTLPFPRGGGSVRASSKGGGSKRGPSGQ